MAACSAASWSPCCMRFSSRVSCDGGLAAAFCCWLLSTWQQYIAMPKRKESRRKDRQPLDRPGYRIEPVSDLDERPTSRLSEAVALKRAPVNLSLIARLP